jgi:hypothetical protein
MTYYNFINSWDNETFEVNGTSYNFSQTDFNNAVTQAQNTPGVGYDGSHLDYGSYGLSGYTSELGPEGTDHIFADEQISFGSDYGDSGLDLLNWVDFSFGYNWNGQPATSSFFDEMVDVLGGNDEIDGSHAVALDFSSGFIQFKSNFNSYNTLLADHAESGNVLFDFWHLDGISDGDYVTAQIVDGSLTDANIMVWGENDEYVKTSFNGTQITWPFVKNDVFTIDTSQMGLDASKGDYSYTVNVVTDWKLASQAEYEQFNWGTIQIIQFGEDNFEQWYSDINWGYVQYGEFSKASYQSTHWGYVQYNEFQSNDYKKASWNRVQMKEFGNDDYKTINWGKIQYNEVIKNSENLNAVNWGKVETNEWDKGDLKFLTKSSTAKKLDKLKKAELDINVLSKGKLFKGDSDDDVITTSGSLLKKKVKVKGGGGNDTFVLKKGKGSIEIQDFQDKKDEINFAYAGSASKIKLKQKGKDTLIYSGSDLLATVKDTKKSVLSKKANGLV